MNEAKITRWGPLLGVVGPILWFLGVTVAESGDTPAEGAGGEEILSHLQNDTTSILLGAVIFMLGTLLFVLFAAVLRHRWDLSGIVPSVSGLSFGCALVGAAFMAATWSPQLGVAIAIEDMDAPLSAAAAESAWHSGTGFFVLGELFLALFLFTTAAALLRTGLVPKWIAWFAVVLGVIALVPPIGWAAIIFGLPIWSLITGITLMMKRPASQP